jgi:hypothetical protein
MYHDQGRDVIFYENAAQPQKRQHAAMMAVPLPYSLGETAPAFFKVGYHIQYDPRVLLTRLSYRKLSYPQMKNGHNIRS